MATRDFKKKPLYRKENTKARGVSHNSGPDYRHVRNTKREKTSNATRGKMVQGSQRGLDYTPLFRFLHSKVGKPWAEVHSEAVSRLDKEEPITWLVALDVDDAKAIVRIGESSFYSGLWVDEAGLLQFVKPRVTIETLFPGCPCCTHTLDGVVFPNKYDAEKHPLGWYG